MTDQLADNLEYRYQSATLHAGSGKMLVIYQHELPTIINALRTSMPKGTKRPVAFRVRRVSPDGVELLDEFRLFNDEREASEAADALGIDYEGLYLVGGRTDATLSTPADDGAKLADNNLYNLIERLVERFGDDELVLEACDTIIGIKSANKRLRASGAGGKTTSSDGSPVQPDQDVARQHEYPDESRSGRKSSRNQSAPSEPNAAQIKALEKKHPKAFLEKSLSADAMRWRELTAPNAAQSAATPEETCQQRNMRMGWGCKCHGETFCPDLEFSHMDDDQPVFKAKTVKPQLDAVYQAAWNAYVEASMDPKIIMFDCIKSAVNVALSGAAGTPVPDDTDHHRNGIRRGIKLVIEKLHQRANEMNDPHAKAVLNSAAFSIGQELKATPPATVAAEGLELHRRVIPNILLDENGGDIYDPAYFEDGGKS